MNCAQVLKKLHAQANPSAVQGMQRYGINPKNNLGISIYMLRQLAKEIGIDHSLALQLWDTGVHDARLLACFIANPLLLTDEVMDTWVKDFDSWDVCDQACTSLFDASPLSWKKVYQWAERDEEFVKRAAFSLLAGLAVHDKQAANQQFLETKALFLRHVVDERNYVKKAVNWALRNIGKRNHVLNSHMIQLAEQLLTIESSSARWIARDALRELTSKKIQQRLKRKEKKSK